VVRSAPTLAPQAHLSEHQDLPVLQKWYSLFATTVYDSLFSPTSLSQSHFQRTCKTLWPPFIWPYVNGEKSPGRGKNAQWDFPKLLVRQRALFQRAGEVALGPKLLPKAQATTFDELLQQETEENSTTGKDNPATTTTSLTLFKPCPSKPPPALPSQSVLKHSTPLLSLLPTLVLTAAYLASHTPPKLDILLFSRLSSSSRSARVKKSYHRRKLFQSPSRTRAGADGGGGGFSGVSGEAGGGISRGGRSPQKRLAVGKSGLEMNLNLPRAFTLERLVAIFRAIHPAGVSRARSVVDRISSAVAELERLRLLVSSDSSGGGSGTRTLGDDAGGEERRWRVNVPRGFVEELGGWYERDGVSGVVREFELLEG
jgi:origin recognition complex subunit 5